MPRSATYRTSNVNTNVSQAKGSLTEMGPHAVCRSAQVYVAWIIIRGDAIYTGKHDIIYADAKICGKVMSLVRLRTCN